MKPTSLTNTIISLVIKEFNIRNGSYFLRNPETSNMMHRKLLASLLYNYTSMTNREVGDILGISPSTVLYYKKKTTKILYTYPKITTSYTAITKNILKLSDVK